MNELMKELLAVFADMGYFGIALGLMVEVIPSELVLGYGGYLVDSGRITFFGAFVAGVTGGTMAQLFLYWMGYVGGRPLLMKYGKYLFINERQLDMAERWFGQYGSGVIFTARFIPVVRHAISIPAGIARMPVSKFIVYTVAAIIPWTILFLYIGLKLGENWNEIKTVSAPYVLPMVVLVVVSIIGYIRYKSKQIPPIIVVTKRK